MNVNEHIWLWNLASIHVLDVRHVMMELGEQLLSYRLPASAFLYATKGSAQVWLDDVVHMTEHFHVFHGGKGTCVDIAAGENFEYYLILYKAMVPVIGGRDIVQLLENERPFDIQYEFPPQYPLALYDSISLMNQERKQGSALEQLHVRALFLQFVYELLWQMDRHGITTVKPDLITQAIRYIHDKYPESLSLDSIAQALNYNVHYFSRKFKRQMGQSPIAYLIQVRMEHAQNLLLNTNATLQEIAERVGYTDLYYFIRIFKKHAGLSPGKYRDSMLNMKKVPDRPFSRFRTPIVKRSPKRYSMDVYENHYQYYGEGDLPMHRRTKSSMAATAFLCLALLLSACSGGATPTQGSVASGGETLPAPTASSAQSADDQTSSLTATRLYKDSGGHEIDIPKNPQRIVLQGNPIGDLLALGIQPVGIDRRFIEGSVYKDKEYTPAEDIGYPTNMETVLSLDPDLTMLSYILDKEYEEASKISPVVLFDGALPMKERFPIIADIVGKKAEAEQLLANYNHKAEAMWNNLRDSGKIADGETAVVLQYFWNRSMYVMKTGGLAELLYQPAGFAMDAKVKRLEPNSGPYIEVAEEAMHETLIGDHLFVLYTGDKEAKKSFDELVKSPLWKSLPAVKNGNVHFMEDKWNYNDMMTSGMLLDEFPKVISP